MYDNLAEISQIDRQCDDVNGLPRYYDIAPMQKWAEQNLDIRQVKVEAEYAIFLLESGAVDADYVVNRVVKRIVEYGVDPVIFCKHASSIKGNHLADGRHRYVALSFMTRNIKEPAYLPAYFFEAHDWTRFVISEEVAISRGFNCQDGS